MAEFYAPQIQQPDILGSYIKGQMAGEQRQMFPYQLQQAQQGVQEGGLKIDQLRMALQKQGIINQVAGQLAGGSQGGSQGGAQSVGGSAGGGIQTGPQAGVSAPQQASGSYNGSPGTQFSQGSMQALGLLAPEAVKGMEEGRQAWLKQAQLSAQMDTSPGSLSFLRDMVNNPNADQMLVNNPSLMGMWAQLAPKFGVDPRQITPANVQRVASSLYNQKAIPLELPPINAPAHFTSQSGPLGSLYQTNDLTNETKQVKGEEPLKDVIGPNGLPTNLRASAAEGKQPFNQSIFGASNLSDQAKEFAYQSFAATGKMPANFGRNPAMQASLMDYVSKRAAQEGNTAVSIAAKGQAFQAAQGVVKGFESGQEAKTLNGINTAVTHMAALDPLIDNLNNTDAPAFNKAANFFKQQVGSPAPTNFQAIKEFVAGEVAKAVLPGGGGEKEREALAAPLNAANSPEMLKQAVQQIKTALAGKTEALRNQWDVGTMGNQGTFDKFLLPETKKALGIQSAPAGGGDVPVMTPDQARSAPKGTKFKTTDGRVLVKQ